MLINKIMISMTLSASVISVASQANTLEKTEGIKATVNKSPRITTSSLPAATEGSEYTFTVNAKDPEAQALKFRLLSGPKALTINNEGVLTFTPDFDTAGVHQVIVAVSDGIFVNQKTLKLIILNTNRAPFFTSKATLNASENFHYTYPIIVDDQDKDDQLSLTLLEGPKGLSLNNSKLQWLPGFEDEGQYPVKLQVTDQHGASTIQSFQIQVINSNQLPVWKTQELIHAKEALSFNEQLLAHDPDGKTISYVLIKGPSGMQLSESGKFTFTPDYTQAGHHKVEILAKDDISATAIEFKLVIENTNRAPIFNSNPPLIAAENSPYKYKLLWQDDDKDKVIIQLIEYPEGMSLEGNTVKWLPNFETTGQHKVKISMNDHKDTSEQTFFIDVASTNRLPSLATVTDNQIQILENTPWSLKLDTTDADGQDVKLALETKIGGLRLSGDTLSWTPNYEQAGTYNIVINANDGVENKAIPLNLIVNNNNRAPVIETQPLQTAKEGELYQYKLAISDADKTPLKVRFSTAPKGMEIINNTLVWQPDFEQAGFHRIEWLVDDGELNAKQSFDIDVKNTNRAPVFNSQPILKTFENIDYQYTISVFDPDGADVKLDLLQHPEGMELIKLNNSDTNTDSLLIEQKYALRYKPDFNAANTYSVVLQAQDSESSTQQAFTLEVSNTNRLPEFTTQPKTKAYESIPFSYDIKATDADSEKLSYSLSQYPEGMVLKNQQLTWLPQYHNSGEHNVVVIVSDGIDKVEQRFNLKVNETNRSPVIAKIKTQSVIAQDKFRYTLEANDIDEDKLTFKLINGPKNMSISRSGKLSWRTKTADIGEHTIVVEASDGDLKTRRYFTLNIVEAEQDQ